MYVCVYFSVPFVTYVVINFLTHDRALMWGMVFFFPSGVVSQIWNESLQSERERVTCCACCVGAPAS